MLRHSRPSRPLRTDTGTVALHWLIVATLAVAAATGLAIAADAPDREWLHSLQGVLPGGAVWRVHAIAGLALAALFLAYAVYMRRAGLAPRVRLDRVRLGGLKAGGRSRWAALNVVLLWLCFAALLVQVATGALLYAGFGGTIVRVHFYSALALIAFPVVHVVVHLGVGGLPQLLRIVRPERLLRRGPEPTLAELVSEHLSEIARRDQRRHRPTRLEASPFSVAAASGLTIAALVMSVDTATRDVLVIRHIERAQAPHLDGDLSEPVWMRAPVTAVRTQQGANLGGRGASTVEIRAVHDGEWAYFAFTWDDPTRSMKHLPLVKKADGWRLLHTRYDTEDENAYYEDKFSVMLADSPEMPAAGAVHIGRQPLADKPAAFSGRGLHYTTDGSVVDVWHWKAARGGLLGVVDDNFFGPPAEPKPAEIEGRSRYKAGYGVDPGASGFANNFAAEPPGGYAGPLKPKRLPKLLAVTQAAMGRVDLDPDVGEPEGARWWMTEEESEPYSAEADTRIPVGTVIPGVLIMSRPDGDRADVICAARWSAGRWTLEVRRRLDTRSRFDVPISSGISMWVAVFDHTQTRHTRHMRPIRLQVE